MRNRGISIIEVLIIVALLSILAMIAFFTFKNQMFKGYDARRKADLDRIKIAVEEYEKDYNCYPPYLPSCRGADAGILKSYIPKIPCDPHTKTDYVYYADPTSICARWAWLFSNLENTGDPKISDIGCQNGCGYSRTYTPFNYYVATPGAPDPFREGNPNIPPDVNGDFYGCFSGNCIQISINPETGLPSCQPSYTNSNCRNLCRDENGNPINQCN